MLEAFGVNRQVEAVYLTLLNQPAAGVRDVACLLGLSEEQVHDALDELARLSLVRPSCEESEKSRLVSPDIALGYLLAKEQAELLQRQHQIDSSRDAIAMLIAKLAAQQGPPPPAASLDQVSGLEAIRTKLAELAYGTKEQVLSLMPDGPQTKENIEASRPLDEMLLRRGVEILTIYLDSVRNSPLNREYVGWLLEMGGEVRTTAVLPMRLLVFDRKIAVVPLNPGQSEAGAVILQGAGPVAAMCALFDQLWTTSAPYGENREHRRDVSLTEQEFAVVQLLAQGDTDAAIGRKLGVSTRTAGRLAAEILTRLEAKSRFQAGLRIGELGWHLVPPGHGAAFPAGADRQPVE